MANVNAPFGFQQWSAIEGAAQTGGQFVRRVDKDNGTAIFHGDPVTSAADGYIVQSTAGTTQIAGIFVGCRFLSSVTKKMEWSNFWPGSGATEDAYAYIINDPRATFKAQSNGSPFTLLDINRNVNFAVGTGNTATGISGASLNFSTLAADTDRPFRIVSLYSDFAPPGVAGADDTSSYNWAIVTFNFQDYKSLTGI